VKTSEVIGFLAPSLIFALRLISEVFAFWAPKKYHFLGFSSLGLSLLFRV
jgi:hypothetical protein